MSTEPRTILAATSLDEASDNVIRAAHEWAKRTGASWYVFHAGSLPTNYIGAASGFTTVDPGTLEHEAAWRKVLAEEQMRRVGLDEPAWPEIITCVGAPHRMLLETAEDLDPDLIVLGASNHRGPFAPLLGSTADRVLRKSRWPVLVVRGELVLPPERVLAPVDLSPLAESSLRRGLTLLETMSGGASPNIEMLFVVSQLRRNADVSFDAEQVDRFANEELTRLVGRLGKPAMHFERRVEVGLPRQRISARMQEHPFHLVVLGTHGRSGFERLMTGSVASSVVQTSPSSVLVIPPTPEVIAVQERERTAAASRPRVLRAAAP